MNPLAGIVPEHYVPPFLRNQFVAEEIAPEVVMVGHYPASAIPDCTASYTDRRSQKRVTLFFHGGEVWKIER